MADAPINISKQILFKLGNNYIGSKGLKLFVKTKLPLLQNLRNNYISVIF